MTRPLSIIEAPLFVGAGLRGTEDLPQALLRAGLADRLGAEVVAGPGPMTWDGAIDATVSAPDLGPIAAWLRGLADATARELQAGRFPVVLGGDCTVLIGAAAACRRAGVRRLLSIDAHTDFSLLGDPEFETASADLAIVTGHGPRELTHLDGEVPFRPEDCVLFGFRDDEYVAAYGGGDPRAAGIHCLPLSHLRARGFGNALRAGLDHLTATGAPFWIHLDLDALDDAVLPAVDYRLPGGLSVGEVQASLIRARATGLVAGITVTILNPTLDHDGSQTRLVVDMLARGLLA